MHAGSLGGIAPLLGTLGIVSSYYGCAALEGVVGWRGIVLVPVLPALMQLMLRG
jgi:hypothetical protein